MSSYHPFQRFNNEHLLYIDCGVATASQIVECLKNGLRSFSRKLHRALHSQIRVNVVQRDNGQMMGYAYVWVTNKEVYHALIGNNIDGTPRIRNIRDPHWKEGTSEQIAELNRKLEVETNWADIDELSTEIENLTACPTISEKLPPLITLKPCKYTTEQRNKLLLDHNTNNEEKKTLDDIPLTVMCKVERGYVNNVRQGYSRDTITCKKVPLWVTPMILKQIFEPYIENKDIQATRRVGGKKMIGRYPLIHITRAQVAYICFDDESNDASFSLAMCMRLPISSPDKKCTEVLHFYYAKQREISN